MSDDISEKKFYLKHQFAPLFQKKTKQNFFHLLNMILTLMASISFKDRMENFQILICLHTF